MNEEVTPETGQSALDEIISQPDVLEILRRGPSLSIEDIDGIDASIEILTTSVNERLERFISEKMPIEFSGIDVFDLSLKSKMDNEQLITARIDGDEEEFLAAVSIKPATLRILLALTLCGTIEKADLTEPITLSFSERRIFTRFADQLMSGHFENISENPELQIPRTPNIIDSDELAELAFIGQLVRIKYNFHFNDNTYEFYILASQSLLDADKTANDDDDGIDLTIQASQEASWKKSMLKVVEHLGLPFCAQLVDVEKPLTYVSSLKVGDILDVELNLEQVKVVDDDNNLAFWAWVDVQNDETLIRAIGSPSKSGN